MIDGQASKDYVLEREVFSFLLAIVLIKLTGMSTLIKRFALAEARRAENYLIVHLWKFDDDADRRNHWNSLFANDDFMDFAGDLRPLLLSQQNQLLNAAPWGPHP